MADPHRRPAQERRRVGIDGAVGDDVAAAPRVLGLVADHGVGVGRRRHRGDDRRSTHAQGELACFQGTLPDRRVSVHPVSTAPVPPQRSGRVRGLTVVVDDLDVVAVGVEHEGGVVAGVVLGRARRARRCRGSRPRSRRVERVDDRVVVVRNAMCGFSVGGPATRRTSRRRRRTARARRRVACGPQTGRRGDRLVEARVAATSATRIHRWSMQPPCGAGPRGGPPRRCCRRDRAGTRRSSRACTRARPGRPSSRYPASTPARWNASTCSREGATKATCRLPGGRTGRLGRATSRSRATR